MKVSLTIEASTDAELDKLRVFMDGFAFNPAGDKEMVSVSESQYPNTAQVNIAPGAGDVILPQTDAPLNTAGEGLDSRGVPWSAEHHSGTKTIKKNGAWKAKSGYNKEALAAYEAQYSNVTTLVPQTPAPTPAPDAQVILGTPTPDAMPGTTTNMPPAVTPPSNVTNPAAVVLPMVPTPDAMATAAPVTPPPVIPAPVATDTLSVLTHRLSEIVRDDIHSHDVSSWGEGYETLHTLSAIDAVNKLLGAYGVAGFGELTDHPDKIDAINHVVDLAWPR